MVTICRICRRIVPKVDPDNLCDECGGYDKSSVLPNYWNLWQVDEACKKCTFPMHVGHGQEHRFCPNCTADAIQVKKGREQLARAKAILEERRQLEEEQERVINSDDQPPYWPEGMAL
jgi:Zn finger protein HypA/HybF involved in hydrogenase expression